MPGTAYSNQSHVSLNPFLQIPEALRPESRLPSASAQRTVRPALSVRFGMRLKSLRLASGMTQEKMAKRFGIDRSYISDLERGKKSVSLSTLEILSLGLNVSLSHLLKDL